MPVGRDLICKVGVELSWIIIVLLQIPAMAARVGGMKLSLGSFISLGFYLLSNY